MTEQISNYRAQSLLLVLAIGNIITVLLLKYIRIIKDTIDGIN